MLGHFVLGLLPLAESWKRQWEKNHSSCSKLKAKIGKNSIHNIAKDNY